MNRMFANTAAFNQDISTWDVSNVEDMWGMFVHAKAFNQDISTWNVSNVRDMTGMFWGAKAFNQDISPWDISNVEDMSWMFDKVTLSTSTYDSILNGWSTQSVLRGVAFHGGKSKYSKASAAARKTLIEKRYWSISDGGPE